MLLKWVSSECKTRVSFHCKSIRALTGITNQITTAGRPVIPAVLLLFSSAVSCLCDPAFKRDCLPCGSESPGKILSEALRGGKSGEIHVWRAVRASKGKSNIYRTGNIDSADVKAACPGSTRTRFLWESRYNYIYRNKSEVNKYGKAKVGRAEVR